MTTNYLEISKFYFRILLITVSFSKNKRFSLLPWGVGKKKILNLFVILLTFLHFFFSVLYCILFFYFFYIVLYFILYEMHYFNCFLQLFRQLPTLINFSSLFFKFSLIYSSKFYFLSLFLFFLLIHKYIFTIQI